MLVQDVPFARVVVRQVNPEIERELRVGMVCVYADDPLPPAVAARAAFWVDLENDRTVSSVRCNLVQGELTDASLELDDEPPPCIQRMYSEDAPDLVASASVGGGGGGGGSGARMDKARPNQVVVPTVEDERARTVLVLRGNFPQTTVQDSTSLAHRLDEIDARTELIASLWASDVLGNVALPPPHHHNGGRQFFTPKKVPRPEPPAPPSATLLPPSTASLLQQQQQQQQQQPQPNDEAAIKKVDDNGPKSPPHQGERRVSPPTLLQSTPPRTFSVTLVSSSASSSSAAGLIPPPAFRADSHHSQSPDSTATPDDTTLGPATRSSSGGSPLGGGGARLPRTPRAPAPRSRHGMSPPRLSPAVSPRGKDAAASLPSPEEWENAANTAVRRLHRSTSPGGSVVGGAAGAAGAAGNSSAVNSNNSGGGGAAYLATSSFEDDSSRPPPFLAVSRSPVNQQAPHHHQQQQQQQRIGESAMGSGNAMDDAALLASRQLHVHARVSELLAETVGGMQHKLHALVDELVEARLAQRAAEENNARRLSMT